MRGGVQAVRGQQQHGHSAPVLSDESVQQPSTPLCQEIRIFLLTRISSVLIFWHSAEGGPHEQQTHASPEQALASDYGNRLSQGHSVRGDRLDDPQPLHFVPGLNGQCARHDGFADSGVRSDDEQRLHGSRLLLPHITAQ